ncbi:MAG TPA: protein kinase, partial [Bryobacteraceae bacterium]|nr:protein kinase [Bryobacteraceae bacterium]
MSRRTNLQDRYELKEVLGRGGMGVVYKAWDTVMRREVALKTILDVSNPSLLELFYKEWGVLSTMVHPNLIGIYDIGEFEHEGARKPFFVMPLLPGVTLDRLIKDGSPRLTVPKIVDLIVQASRGIHAAHEKDLVHRDIKPSNIFVMDDDSVKIIDFGIAREASTASKTSLKGTLFYLSPEQLQLKPPTPLSDQYALAVVAYEALTRRRPFTGTTDAEVVEAILKSSPPPASELNAQVPYAVSQVVHKALAKQPFHRFFNVREFGDALLKSLRNEALEYFDSSKIKPRLERARTSFESGDYVFAGELLAELEGEGHLDQEISMLRSQLDHAVRKTSIRSALESARRFVDAQEFPLALRKIQEAIELDPQDPDALALKSQVERERRERKIDEWMQLARQHASNSSFRQAREALDNVLQLKPNETNALQLLHEVDRKEQEIAKTREEKSKLYQMAQQAWERGEVTSALSKLEVLVNLDKDVPESDTGRSTTYQNFFNQVRSEHDNIKNSYEEARRHLAADNFDGALAICRQFISKYPNHALFQSLKFDVEERQRQRMSALIAETDQRAAAEPDLDKRMALLEEIAKQNAGESHFERALRNVKDKRDLVNSITGKARYFEERGQFNEALDQWQILRSIHEEYPGLVFEIQRLQKRRDQQAREDAQVNWVKEIDRHLEMGDYERAARSMESATKEFPADPELAELAKLVQKSQVSATQAAALLGQARERIDASAAPEALPILREATALDPRSAVIRKVLINTLLDEAQRNMETSPEAAEPLVAEILSLEPTNPAAQALDAQIADRKRDEFLSWCLSQARRLQSDGDFDGALAVVAQGRGLYPNETRLQQLQATLQKGKAEQSLARNREATKPSAASIIPPGVAKDKAT